MSNSSKLVYLILTLAIAYSFIYPATDEIPILLEQKQQHEESLLEISNIENKKNELQKKFENMPASEKSSIEKIIPDNLNFVKLVSDIDSVASKYGISIDNVSSSEISPPSEDGTTESDGRIYRSAKVGFVFTSSYDDFKKFMNDLENSLRILDIRSVTIQPLEKGLYNFDVNFETYWLK